MNFNGGAWALPFGSTLKGLPLNHAFAGEWAIDWMW